MQLSTPPLKIPLNDFLSRKFEYVYFRKNEFLCMDGFAKEKALSLVIMPAVMRGHFPYNGIKPAVLIVDKELEKPEMRELAEKEQERDRFKKDKTLSRTEISDREIVNTAEHICENKLLSQDEEKSVG